MAIQLPSMLAFERKLETSDALMFSGVWENIATAEKWQEIPITKRQNRSTQSAEGTSDADKIKPNPVSSDSDDANLPLKHDTLKVSFSMRVIGSLGNPFGCNSPDFSKAIKTKTADFKQGEGVNDLAYRYAYNIANGRFLWRNRVGAEEISIVVKAGDHTLNFSAYDFSLTEFEKGNDNSFLQQLTAIIAEGLKGDEKSFVLIEVDAFVKLGYQQHVFPSQEMNMGEKGKVLFKLDGCAAIHNVKIGNAIRTIDTWYNRYAEQKQPIAIEPFGAVTQIGDAFRKNKKEGDLYSLMVDWVNDIDLTPEQQMFVTANLIRGGVFSKSSK
ncbi:type I-F CRISPR-associated protein Csy3 [Saccharobesus litoralis]|uniref:Type I-F CRISPR-associated protein Csy3 n=1 Tax=Saccharobesus litoralis TaxID=2172099 RepID=A0A2S0VSW0_9ALTE|nr:type I-F CRISPR-associated protein Csy3 [Saccharobesus litoralis]AWB67287.1 type I-F CRISPR-associated protein Csy3 [Saccharobesus litoralis]